MKLKLTELISNFDLFNLCLEEETPIYKLSTNNKTSSTYTIEMLSLMNKVDKKSNSLNEIAYPKGYVYVKNFESFLQSEPSPKIQSYMGGINDENDIPEEEEEE